MYDVDGPPTVHPSLQTPSSSVEPRPLNLAAICSEETQNIVDKKLQLLSFRNYRKAVQNNQRPFCY